MDIDIHITNATPEDIKKAFQAISGSKEREEILKVIKQIRQDHRPFTVEERNAIDKALS